MVCCRSGWTGSTKHWQRHESLITGIGRYEYSAGIISAHGGIVRLRYLGNVPGWHTTIFPPYFVAGAIFSGFAMVQTLLLISRKVLGLEDYITIEHIEVMNKVIVLTGSIVGIAYLTELFISWYGQNPNEGWAFAQNSVEHCSAPTDGATG